MILQKTPKVNLHDGAREPVGSIASAGSQPCSWTAGASRAGRAGGWPLWTA